MAKEWDDILWLNSNLPQTNHVDIIKWRWTSNGSFTVKSFDEWLAFGGVPNTEFDYLWMSKLPLKIKISIWLVRKNKILTKDNLVKK